MAASSHGTICDTIVLRCQHNDDTIDRTTYGPRTLEAIIALRLYTVFRMNMSLVEEEMLVVWWMKRRWKKEVTRRKQPAGFPSYYNKSGKLDSFL